MAGWFITPAPVSPAVARLRGPCYNRDRLGDLQRGARLDPLALQTRFAVGVGALVASLAALAALAVALGVPPLAVAGAELVLGLLSAIPLARSLARALSAQMAREREHLEQRTRDLQRLHEVGLGLAEALESEGVLGLVAEAARALSGVDVAQVVAQIGSRERPWWSSPAAPPFTIERRKALEAELGRRRAEGAVALPSELPEGARAVGAAHGDA